MGKTLTRFFALLCAAAGLAGAPSVAHATWYTLFDLGTLGAPGDWQQMHATGLNNSGQVVGYATHFTYEPDGGVTQTTQAWVTGANGIGMTAIATLGGAWNRANGINDAGWVVGKSLTASGSEHAFVTGPNGASPRDLGTLGGSSSSAAAINAGGQVVGTSTTATGIQRGFISDAQAGKLHDLGSLYEGSATATTTASAINAAGQVTGVSRATAPFDGTDRAFITGPNGAAMRPVSVAGEGPNTPSWGLAINASGQTAGQTMPVDAYHRAFFAEADGSGRPLQLPVEPEGPGPALALNSWASGLNASGQAVGYYFTASVESGLFVTGPDGSDPMPLHRESFTGLTGPLPAFSDAAAINDAGQFIASASNGHAYLISPVPEPAVVLMMVCGLGWVFWRRREASLRA